MNARQGANLGDLLRENFPDLTFPCGGEGRCGKCTFRLEAGLPDEAAAAPRARTGGGPPDTDRTSSDGPDGERPFLACRFRVSSDLVIRPDFRPEGDPVRVEALIDPGEKPEGPPVPPAGIALDLGTTNLVMSVLDAAGTPMARATAANPQQAFGADVMTRIAFVRSGPDGLGLLRGTLLDRLARMAERLCRRVGVAPTEIPTLCAAGNTCMEHIFAGVDPGPLGTYPYEPSSRFGTTVEATEPGVTWSALGLASDVAIYAAPILSGFVGGDVSAGMLATGMLEDEGTSLLVDIGTNGEILLARGGQATATSTAAGPAFEGASLSCGMTAGPGAIEGIDLDDGVRLKLIGDLEPIGICGTGILSALARFVEGGIIDSTGRMVPPEAWKTGLRDRLSHRYETFHGKPAFRLAPGILITQEDVRQVQLAKAAVRTGIDLILEEAGLSPEEVDRVYVAGAFGRRLHTADAVAIGLFPVSFLDRALPVGNTSLAGAERLLAHPETREPLTRACRRVASLDLMEGGRFTGPFVENLRFS